MKKVGIFILIWIAIEVASALLIALGAYLFLNH